MNKTISLLALLCFFFIAHAQTNGRAVWQNLFNGKDLSGWKQLNGKAKYTIQNNEIVGTTVMGEPNSFLATEKNYGDFIVELEFKVDSTMNSGIQFRSESTPDYQNGRVHGYQYEIDPSSRNWTGGIYDEARRDWLYPLGLNRPARNAFRQNEWNKARIECIGNTMRSFVNGIAAAYLVDDLTPTGFIALQVHAISSSKEEGKTIHWRNIRIQTTQLQPTPSNNLFVVNLLPNNISDQEKSNGVKLLFDGKTTDGWRAANKITFPEKGWEVKDGTINVQPANGTESKNGGDIVTQQQYGAFVLQFDFKLTEGANSGVKYFVTEKDSTAGSAIGLEYQVLDDAKHPDAKLGAAGNRTLASLYDLIPSLPETRARRAIGQWNRGMVIVYTNNKVEHYLNGWKVLEYQRGGPIFSVLVARSKFEKYPNFGLAPIGHILLQDHGDAVSFRSIKIKTLQPGEMASDDCGN